MPRAKGRGAVLQAAPATGNSEAAGYRLAIGGHTDWDRPPGDDCQWRVLHVRSRQEKRLAETLDAAGIDCFLPLFERYGYHARARVLVREPLFPGYVFLRGSLEDAFAADRGGRVVGILPAHDQFGLHEELRQLHLALLRGVSLQAAPFLRAGARVFVTAGPFEGMTGVVEHLGRDSRLTLQIRSLGQAVSLEIDWRLLAPAEGDEGVDG